MPGTVSPISDVLQPFELRSMGQAFILELTANDHRAAVRLLKAKLQQRSAKSMALIESAVEDMNNAYRKLELLGNYVTQNKVETLTKIVNEWESKRLKVAILPSTVEKIKYDSVHQENENESEVQKQFFRRLFDHIDGDKAVQLRKSPETKLVPKKKGGFEKVKKFLRLSVDKNTKVQDLIKAKQTKEALSPFSPNKLDPSADVALTPVKNSPIEAPLSKKRSNGHLSAERLQEKLLINDEAEITAPAKTPTKKPWYKFW